MRKPLTVIIVTLSVVCTLKGACQYILFDVGGVKIGLIQEIIAMSKVSKIFYRFQCLNAMYVKNIEDGVCGFYTTLHTELLNLLLMSKVSKMSNMYSVYSGLLTLPAGKAILAFRLGDLVVYHQSV